MGRSPGLASRSSAALRLLSLMQRIKPIYSGGQVVVSGLTEGCQEIGYTCITLCSNGDSKRGGRWIRTW